MAAGGAQVTPMIEATPLFGTIRVGQLA